MGSQQENLLSGKFFQKAESIEKEHPPDIFLPILTNHTDEEKNNRNNEIRTNEQITLPRSASCLSSKRCFSEHVCSKVEFLGNNTE